MKSHPLQRSTQPCPITKEKSLTSHNRFPVFELFSQAMRSDAAAVTILIIMCVAAFAAVAGCQQVRYSHDVKDERTTSNELLQTASRLTWAFARDKGFIGSSRLSRIHPRWDVPIWALCANQVVIFIIGCVYLGSTTAFNAFIGTGLILQLITFAFPAALLLMRRRSRRSQIQSTFASWLDG
jgi:choline transport protein